MIGAIIGSRTKGPEDLPSDGNYLKKGQLKLIYGVHWKFSVVINCIATSTATLSLNMVKARPLVFCGPSGVGKSTLVKRLLQEFSDVFGFSISHTTRNPREGEKDGREYHFVSRTTMEEAIKNGEFIESAEFSGNMYGTSKRAVEDVQKKGKICILDIDTQGVKQIKLTKLEPRLVFVKPPSLKDLESRLRLRGTETEESLQRRLAVAQAEMEYGEAPGNFELVLVNDEVDSAYMKLRNFLLPDITELRDFLAKISPNPAYQNGSGDKKSSGWLCGAVQVWILQFVDCLLM
ncbi:unnamed protein product [Allacma fusca]|uniref:guanylate kinase n=1 Tax=Allacma fusca TaxID=39272 RepID=A0A8J2KXD9_9HEXA|nr:unnamed protein product [Allacma fusca]